MERLKDGKMEDVGTLFFSLPQITRISTDFILNTRLVEDPLTKGK